MESVTRGLDLDGGDPQRLHALLQRAWAVEGADAQMHVGDLYWGLFRSPTLDFERRIRLWLDGKGRVVAMGAFFRHDWLDYAFDPELEVRPWAEAMLDWADRLGPQLIAEQGDGARLRVGRRNHDPVIVELLERRGFVRMSHGYPTLQAAVDGELAPIPPLPEGYRCVPSVRPIDAPARAAAINAAFGRHLRDPADLLAMTHAHGYDPGLDLTVLDGSGQIAAFAYGWLDRHNRCGLCEPLGVMPGHRRQGLARALLMRLLKAMRRHGARTAVIRVAHDNDAAAALYQRCGFRVASRWFGHERPGSEP